ncbi:MAG: hypothetical protein ACRD8O_03650 [Bryobacteraceae bacterium]
MTRAMYRGLLWLHPPAFRREFAGEMLWIFDEAAAAQGASALLVDGVVSLARQWVIGRGLWKVAAGMLGALLQMLMALPLAPPNAPRTVAQRVDVSQLLSQQEWEFSRALLVLFAVLVVAASGLRSRVAASARRRP